MLPICLLILANVFFASASRSGISVKSAAEWKDVEFAFPTEELRLSAIADGKYIAGNAVPIDMDVDYRYNGLPRRIFVSTPRFSKGVPMTFGIVTGSSRPGPMISAYPDYSWHSSHGANCDGLTSVFRVAIDKCRRLWVLDTGMIGDRQHCHPQLVVFNLNNDKVIHRYRFPVDQYINGTSLFITPLVDVRDAERNCLNTMVYIADVTGYALIVYDYRRNLSWKIKNDKFKPTNSRFTIAGESFDLSDGLFALAIAQQQQHFNSYYNQQHHRRGYHLSFPSQRFLLFHSLASYKENAVSLNLIDDSRNWKDSNAYPEAFAEIGSREIQTASQAMDRNGNLYFVLMDPIAIACWDSRTQYTKQNIKIVYINNETLQFASGVKVINNNQGKQELWVSTCRFQKIMTGSMNKNEKNFRIQIFSIDQLLGGAQHCSNNVSYRPFNFVRRRRH